MLVSQRGWGPTSTSTSTPTHSLTCVHCLLSLSPLCTCMSIFPEIMHCLTRSNTAGGVFVPMCACVCVGGGKRSCVSTYGGGGGVVLLKLWNSLMETSCHLALCSCLWNSGNEIISCVWEKMTAQQKLDKAVSITIKTPSLWRGRILNNWAS